MVVVVVVIGGWWRVVRLTGVNIGAETAAERSGPKNEKAKRANSKDSKIRFGFAFQSTAARFCTNSEFWSLVFVGVGGGLAAACLVVVLQHCCCVLSPLALFLFAS